MGGQAAIEAGFEDLWVQGRGRVHPLTIPKTMANAGASHISMDLGLSGPVYTVSTACSSANHAIGQAFRLVRDGEADLAVTGGAEAFFTIGMLKAWEAMRVIAPDTCRPFSKDRRGMILGEGGAMMILEPMESAQARGAKIYAEICGFGMTSDAHHLTQPTDRRPRARHARRSARGGTRARRRRLHQRPRHGHARQRSRWKRRRSAKFSARTRTSSPSAPRNPCTATPWAPPARSKPIATVLALHHGILPPTANFTEADPECDLDYIPNKARVLRVGAALSNSFAFGGLNAVVAFRSA